MALAVMKHNARAVASKPNPLQRAGARGQCVRDGDAVQRLGPSIDGAVGGPNTAVDIFLSPLDALRNIDNLVSILDGIYVGWGEVHYVGRLWRA